MTNILADRSQFNFAARDCPLAEIRHSDQLRMPEILETLGVNIARIFEPLHLPTDSLQAGEAEFEKAFLMKTRLAPLVNGTQEQPRGAAIPTAGRPFLEARPLDRYNIYNAREASQTLHVVFPNDDDRQQKLMLFMEQYQPNGQPNTLLILATELHDLETAQAFAQGLYIVKQECSYSRWLRQCIGECPNRKHCQHSVRLSLDGPRDIGFCAED
ncbi:MULTISPECIES: hypothetical protein [unclassified Kitasatospora]|uniref:hypothetical protein n=1 Tax=unclassified Kitasatospora TaxID=2633591 RepID=UPI0024739887|nr:hypothetical protein [Kitasatospora sp. MAP12-44]